MFTLNPEFNTILQALIIFILFGMLYSLWLTSRAYGGIIGSAVRYLGVGIIFTSVVVLEKMLINFSVIENSSNLQLAQDVLTLVSLMFLSWGFKKLASVAKA